jgi:hypothetical protein
VPPELSPQVRGGAEATAVGDVVQAARVGFQQVSGKLDPLAVQPGQRGNSQLSLKASVQCRDARARVPQRQEAAGLG